MPRMLDDVLARRTRALFLDVKASVKIAPEVADIMMQELDLSYSWKDEQLRDYNKLVLNYL
jgi:glycerol-3-phosphate dehydrogenase